MRTFSLGAGADVVKFTSADEANANTITNFTVANDKLSFSQTAFTGYAGGSISAFEDAYGSSSYKTATKGKAYFIDGVTHTLESAKTEFKSDSSTAANITIVVDQSNGNIYAFNFNTSNDVASAFDLVGTVGSAAGAALTLSNLEVFSTTP